MTTDITIKEMMERYPHEKKRITREYKEMKKRSKDILKGLNSKPPIKFKTPDLENFVIYLFSDSSKISDWCCFDTQYDSDMWFKRRERETFNKEYEDKHKSFLEKAEEEFQERHRYNQRLTSSQLKEVSLQ